MSDPGFSYDIQAPDITPDTNVSLDDPTFQAPSIMGGVDFSGNDLPMNGQTQNPSRAADIAGKIWNLPNTALGLAYGGAGYLAGLANYELGGQENMPGIQFGKNAIQFTYNPLAGSGAITLGNAEVFGNNRLSDPGRDAQPMGAPHEEQHTYQGQQLGPLYLPSNILGGVLGEVLDGGWHGGQNWNEVGPLQNPPAPWPKG